MRNPGRDNRCKDTPRGAMPSEPALDSVSLRGATQGTPKPSSGRKELGTDGPALVHAPPYSAHASSDPAQPPLILRLRRGGALSPERALGGGAGPGRAGACPPGVTRESRRVGRAEG